MTDNGAAVGTCGACRYARPAATVNVVQALDGPKLECRRYPPLRVALVVPNGVQLIDGFPTVQPTSGCGEWEHRGPERVDLGGGTL